MSSLWQLTGSKQSALLPVAGHASTYTVGRKDQDVTIDGDKSISRAHCTLEVGADNTLYVTDPGSKFGTFVNGTKLEHHARTALAAGATLKVGETAFEVARVPLVFCASSCKGADKSALQGAAATLGAPVIGEWRADVTHLVMPTIAFTPKLLHALAAAVPVVLPAWAAAAAARTTAGQPLPDVDAFKPAVARAAAGASQTQTLDADVVRVKPERQTLFAGLRFVAPRAATTRRSS